MNLNLLLLAWGCSGPGYDNVSTQVANSILVSSSVDHVTIALNSLDCSSAYETIYPLYNSANSNNSIRLSMAATYGCYATVSLLKIVSDLESSGGNLGGSAFWEFLVTEFPSVTVPQDDKIPQSAEYGVDAAQSIITPGVVVNSSDLINSTSNNPASLLYTDRVNDANAYLTFISMALMGSLLNRYGLPSSNHHKSVALPWTTAAATPGDGCAFVSGLLNFYDGLTLLETSSTGNVQSAYASIQSYLSQALTTACSQGCTACGGGLSCNDCPTTLRSRASCTGSTTDVNSCAAAGVTSLLVNLGWTGPP